MFIEPLMTLIQETTYDLFHNDVNPFPYDDMRDLPVHIEYPVDQALYPGVWVNFIPQGEVRNVGIGHVERVDTEEGIAKVYRWQFGGLIEIVAHALTNLERARMLDWVAKAIAFGHLDTGTSLSRFREGLERNDLIGLRPIWEAFTVGGLAETPGTPWGTDDVIYEGTITLTVEGEYVHDPSEDRLVPLSEIVVEEPEILPPDAPPDHSPADPGWV